MFTVCNTKCTQYHYQLSAILQTTCRGVTHKNVSEIIPVVPDTVRTVVGNKAGEMPAAAYHYYHARGTLSPPPMK